MSRALARWACTLVLAPLLSVTALAQEPAAGSARVGSLSTVPFTGGQQQATAPAYDPREVAPGPIAPVDQQAGGQLHVGGPDSLSTVPLTTGFGQGGNAFDVTPSTSLRIRAMDVNFSAAAGTPRNIDVWYREGTSQGHELDPTGWSLLSSGSAIAAGPGLPTTVTLPSALDVLLKAGKTYGILFVETNAAGIQVYYTSGGPSVFANEDLMLRTNAGVGLPAFGGLLFQPRIWEGTLYYVTQPNLNVLVVPADSAVNMNDAKAKLDATGKFNQVDVLDARSNTPGLAQLLAYDAVITWSNFTYQDATVLGDNLADYVDAGGGVVVAVFATSTTTAGRSLGGRFRTGGYEAIVTMSGNTTGAATLGAVAIPGHPVMKGVTSFDGGSSSFRPTGTALTPGSALIASWSDGKVLAAEGRPGRIDLGFFPPSSDLSAGNWQVSTDGDLLMANALCAAARRRPRIAVAASVPVAGYATDVQVKLLATGRFSGVDLIATGAGTPSLGTLLGYDAVLMFTDSVPADANALGDVLADYVDAGGGVVAAVFANTAAGLALGGRWATGGYEVILAGSGQTQGGGPFTLGAVQIPNHPVMENVLTFDGGTSSYRPTVTALQAGAKSIAEWSDARVLIAEGASSRRIDLGFYPPSQDTGRADFWNPLTDGVTIMANSLIYVSCDPDPCGGIYTYCTAGTTSDGCNATMGAVGVPSASASSGFTLTTTNVPGNKNGILFYGLSGPNSAPWGNSTSFLCVKAPTQRMGLLSSGGAPLTCNGTFSLDWLDWVANHPSKLGVPFSPGCGVWAQAWFRDPASGTGPVGAKGTATSNGLHFVTCP